MKTLLLFLLLPLFSVCQMYTWGPGTNPAWTSSNLGNSNLGWQSSINTVSTSGFNNGTGNWYTYNNSQITTYTSPIIDLTGCATSSFISVNLSLEINLENRYDWLYFQYSTNGGTTWINPVALSASTNASGVNLGAYAPLTAYANVNSNRNGWTGNLGVINPTYTIPNTANRFRYIFATDPSVNSYIIGFTMYVYYADLLNFTVTCPVFLPVELISFKGFKKTDGNKLEWLIESESDCDFYTIERSTDGFEWETIGNITATNSYSYTLYDDSFRNVINYYRLSQTDFNGQKVVYENDVVSIDNRTKDLKVIRVTNLLGQEVDESTHGVIIVTYEDGSSVKKVNE